MSSIVCVCIRIFIVCKTTGRGVDLNRNWGVDWGKKEKVLSSLHSLSFKIPSLLMRYGPCFYQDYDPYEENPGTAPFSEPETQIMRKLALSFDPHIWINVHSGMEVCCFLLFLI